MNPMLCIACVLCIHSDNLDSKNSKVDALIVGEQGGQWRGLSECYSQTGCDRPQADCP